MTKKIKVITNRDKELFKQLARTSLITREQAQQYLNFDKDNRRLTNLVKDGYLKEEYTKVGKEFKTVYRLNNVGKNYVKNNLSDINGLYKFASVHHDYNLTELYYNQFYEHRDTWKTETDYKQVNSYGAPDATIQIGDRTILIEVITKSYTVEQIQQKEDFGKINNMEVLKFNV